MINITRNPDHINDTHDNRTAAYLGGTASPAVWYWRRKRGDRAIAKNLGLSSKEQRCLSGWRCNSDAKKIEAVFVIGEGYNWTRQINNK
jgi:hypothetical protein